MNFFEHQAIARRNTKLLILFYVLAVVSIIVLVYLALVFCVFLMASSQSGQSSYYAQRVPQIVWWSPEMFTAVAVSVLVLIAIGTLYKIATLSGGGAVVAALLGGVRVQPNTQDPDERKLLNVVEEMAIASGTSVPPVYILPLEYGINAFAAGFSTQDAVIGVTKGAMKILNRDELQGVIAHEFSHIMNGDMRLNLRLMGVLHGILVLALLGQGLLRSMGATRYRSSSRGGGGAIAFAFLMGLSLVVIGYVGVFFGRLIKSAVARQREFLADASAVQFTRIPDGLAGALKKIGGLMDGSRISHPKAEQLSHFYFANGLNKTHVDIMATHPPLPERIKKLDPGFDGTYPKVKALEVEYKVPVYNEGKFLYSGDKKKPARQDFQPSQMTPDKITQQVGRVNTAHLVYAAALLGEMPDVVLDNARDPVGARAVIYALLIDRKNPEVAQKQKNYLFANGNYHVYQTVLKILDAVANLDITKRLPIVEMALPAIREISDVQYAMFRKNIEILIMADEKIEDFEFALKEVVFHHLDAAFGKMKPPETKVSNLRYAWQACVELLSFLACVGCEDPRKAELVFRDALKILGGDRPAQFLTREMIRHDRLEEHLDLLATASPEIKEKFIQAAATAVQHDGVVTPEEADIVRAFADVLNCPIPPFINEPAQEEGATAS
ncbi:MAG: M48 family metallopeptidase [Candidatus Omnitrophica bacterium]|nr:M48 family metallopeptidase [Candidatus Omnitrophota bacterium]